MKIYSEVEVEEDLPTNTYNTKEEEQSNDDFYQEELNNTIPNTIPTTTPIGNIT